MAIEQSLPAARGSRNAERSIGLPVTGASKFAVLLVVSSVFLEKYELEGYSTGSLPLPDFFFMAAIGLLATKLVVDSALGLSFPREISTLDLALIGFVVLLGVTSLWPALNHGHIDQTAKTFWHLCALLFAALVLARTLNDETRDFALRSFFSGASVVAAIGIIQALDQNAMNLGFSEALSLKSRISSGFERPVSIMSEPAYLGYVSLMGAIVGLWVLRTSSGGGLVKAGLVACMSTLLLSAAVGPLLFALCLGCLYLAVGRVKIGGKFVPAAVTFVVVGMLTPAGDVLSDRLGEITTNRDASATARSDLNDASVQIWQHDPITGVGLGNSRFYFADYVHLPGASTPGYDFPAASVYFGLLGETGPFGLGALGLVLVLLISGRTMIRDQTSPESLIRLVLILIAMQFFVIGSFLLPTFWFWAGLRLSMHSDD